MNKLIRHFSIKKKLLSILAFSSAAGLLLAAFIIFSLEVVEFKRNVLDDLAAMAEIVANRSSAALVFDDVTLAEENLTALVQLPIFHSACIYNQEGHVFAEVKKYPQYKNLCATKLSNTKNHFADTFLHIYAQVVLDKDVLGTVYIKADLKKVFLRKIQYIGLLVVVLFLVTVVTFILTMPLLRVITDPLNKLLKTVKIITKEQDYSRRAVKQSSDELGELVDAFNNMIVTVDKKNSDLMVAKDHYRALYDNNPTMVFHLSIDGLILSVNCFGAKQLNLNCDALDECSIFGFTHPDDKKALELLFDLCIATPHRVHKQELRLICQDDRVIWVRETIRLMPGRDGQKHTILLVCEDVTEAKVLSETIVYQASHDALTGLVNRIEFDSVVKKALIEVNNRKTEHALCYLDLDQFKVVNDTSGHLAGDELLRQLGELLKKQIRKGDVLARLGGDEFGILMTNCSLEEAAHTCEKLRGVIQDFQFAWEERSFFVGVSIGISAINSTTGNAVDALKEADSACYAAKERGRNRVHIFRPDDDDLACRQGEMRWVEKIRQGIDENNFVLYGQLIVPIANSEDKIHFETLVRYRDTEGNIIPPGAFLPAAERYNMAPALDRWVVSHLFSWLAENAERLEKISVCSVNLSGVSLTDETMLAFICDAFEHYSIPTHKICFEITETAAITNLGYATKFINQLREQGCLFSLDDFGSGLSSFAYLKNLPVDYLKIDGIFIKDIVDDKVDLAMVKSINEVGHVMGKQTIAEFVENDKILHLLNELGVDFAQGYGIAKPVPLNELKWAAGEEKQSG